MSHSRILEIYIVTSLQIIPSQGKIIDASGLTPLRSSVVVSALPRCFPLETLKIAQPSDFVIAISINHIFISSIFSL
jgi:hypothetical protein